MTNPDDCGPVREVCSAKGCQETPVWQLLWNNPRIHDPQRRKVWLACEAHRVALGDFLSARQFLRDTQPHPPQ